MAKNEKVAVEFLLVSANLTDGGFQKILPLHPRPRRVKMGPIFQAGNFGIMTT